MGAPCARPITPNQTGWGFPPLFRSQSLQVANALAESFAAGAWTEADLIDRGALLLGKRYRWLTGLASRVIAHFGLHDRPRPQNIARFLLADSGLRRACLKREYRLRHAASGVPTMRTSLRYAFPLDPTPIETIERLADLVGEPAADLVWLADLRNLNRNSSQKQWNHYVYTWRVKSNSSARLIESPKARLKAVQRKLLKEVLDRVPAHPAAHAYVKGRSIRTFAAPHAGKRVVLKLDLEGFFPSIRSARVSGLFRLLGYPDAVARTLSALCTNAMPVGVWNSEANPMRNDPAAQPVRARYRERHLPQGAPTSPALANLLAYRLDARLTGLAKSSGAVYTRYADDLAFSGDDAFARRARRFILCVSAIALEEGFTVNHRKTRIMDRAQRQCLAGVIVNARVNCRRSAYDELKAILHNCLVLGVESQRRGFEGDFRAHLSGRAAHLGSLNRARGEKLDAMIAAIDW